MKQLGQQLRSLRLKSGLTQIELARAMGLSSAQFVSNIERGKAALPVAYMRPVARLFGVSEDYLVEMLVQAFRRGVLRDLTLRTPKR